MTPQRGQLQVYSFFLLDFALCSFHSADFNLYPFTIMNSNCENNSFFEFCEPFQWIIKPEGLLILVCFIRVNFVHFAKYLLNFSNTKIYFPFVIRKYSVEWYFETVWVARPPLIFHIIVFIDDSYMNQLLLWELYNSGIFW